MYDCKKVRVKWLKKMIHRDYKVKRKIKTDLRQVIYSLTFSKEEKDYKKQVASLQY